MHIYQHLACKNIEVAPKAFKDTRDLFSLISLFEILLHHFQAFS